MNIYETIGKNLVALRKQHKLTQLEFAEKFDYSDKMVSKWEIGDSMPNIEVLQKIAQFYGVTVNDLIDEEFIVSERKPRNYSRLFISLLALSVIWLIATVIFVYANLLEIAASWLVYIYSVPITCVVGIVFNSLWGNQRMNYLIVSGLTWSLLASIYLSYLSYNIWIIFILGVPIQICIILWSQLKKTSDLRQKKKASDSKDEPTQKD